MRGLIKIAQSAIGQGERIVDDSRVRVECGRGGQMLDGARVVLLREGGPAKLKACRRLVGLERQGVGEPRLGLHRLTQVQVDPTEPHQRRHVGGLERTRALETLAAPDRSPAFLRTWPR